VNTWRLLRLDICYAVRHPMATAAMAYLKRVTLARKKGTVYENSVGFLGSSLYVKWYMKQEEFVEHDLKHLMKADPELAAKVLEASANVLRFEVEVKNKALQQHFERRTVLVGHLEDSFPIDKMRAYLKRWGMEMRCDIWDTEQAKAMLEEAYGKTNGKVARLFGFLLSYQQIGEKALRELMDRTTFYRQKRELEAIGIRVWDFAEEDGIRDLSFITQIPNDFAVNTEDEVWHVPMAVIGRLLEEGTWVDEGNPDQLKLDVA